MTRGDGNGIHALISKGLTDLTQQILIGYRNEKF